MEDCKHEEADSRIFVHVLSALKQGFKNVMIRTVGTDVVVIAVYVMQKLKIDHLWIAFGTGKHFRYIPQISNISKHG